MGSRGCPGDRKDVWRAVEEPVQGHLGRGRSKVLATSARGLRRKQAAPQASSGRPPKGHMAQRSLHERNSSRWDLVGVQRRCTVLDRSDLGDSRASSSCFTVILERPVSRFFLPPEAEPDQDRLTQRHIGIDPVKLVQVDAIDWQFLRFSSQSRRRPFEFRPGIVG